MYVNLKRLEERLTLLPSGLPCVFKSIYLNIHLPTTACLMAEERGGCWECRILVFKPLDWPPLHSSFQQNFLLIFASPLQFCLASHA